MDDEYDDDMQNFDSPDEDISPVKAAAVVPPPNDEEEVPETKLKIDFESQKTCPESCMSEIPSRNGNKQEEEIVEEEQEHVEEENVTAPVVKLNRRERQLQQAMVNHKRRLAQEQHTAGLTRKISQYKKENASLRDQLHRLMNQQGLLYLEDKVKSKQLEIDTLSQENRSIMNQYRNAMKTLEELQQTHESDQYQSMKEEVRVLKEKFRQSKEKNKQDEEKAHKFHQQLIELNDRNKKFQEQIKRLEATSTTSNRVGGTEAEDHSSTQSNQKEEEIIKLQEKIAFLKKNHKMERMKYERQLKNTQEEMEQMKKDMVLFQRQAVDKEKTLRTQVVEVKKLKRSIRDLVSMIQSNNQLQQFVLTRDPRFVQSQTTSPRKNDGTSEPFSFQSSIRNSVSIPWDSIINVCSTTTTTTSISVEKKSDSDSPQPKPAPLKTPSVQPRSHVQASVSLIPTRPPTKPLLLKAPFVGKSGTSRAAKFFSPRGVTETILSSARQKKQREKEMQISRRKQEETSADEEERQVDRMLVRMERESNAALTLQKAYRKYSSQKVLFYDQMEMQVDPLDQHEEPHEHQQTQDDDDDDVQEEKEGVVEESVVVEVEENQVFEPLQIETHETKEPEGTSYIEENYSPVQEEGESIAEEEKTY